MAGRDFGEVAERLRRSTVQVSGLHNCIGRSVIPSSTSAWQLEQRRTHFAASARAASNDMVMPPELRPNRFRPGSR